MPPATASSTATASLPAEHPTPRTQKRIMSAIHQCSFSPPESLHEEDSENSATENSHSSSNSNKHHAPTTPSPAPPTDDHSKQPSTRSNQQQQQQQQQQQIEAADQSPETIVLRANHHVRQLEHQQQQQHSHALPQRSPSTRKLESELAQAAAAVAECTLSSRSHESSSGPECAPPPAFLVGPLSGAWGWLQKKKEQQRQEHLRRLAEEQMRRLQQAASEDGEGDISFQVAIASSSNIASVTMSPPKHKKKAGQEGAAHEEEEEDDVSWIPPVRWVEETPRKRAAPNTIATGLPGVEATPSSDAPSDTTNASLLSTSNSTDADEKSAVVPFLLSPDQMHQIAKYVLPKGIAFCRWKRLYSLTRDGDSFWQCLRLCGQEPKTLLVVKTTRGALLGGYADSPWEQSNSQSASGQFHGSAQACLFSFAISPETEKNSNGDDTTNAATSQPEEPSSQIINNDSQDNSDDDCTNTPASPSAYRRKASRHHVTKTDNPIRVFHWTGANRYIQYCDTTDHRRMLAFGGGGHGGSFGLAVEQDFQRGSTGRCDTFDNLPLCEQEQFSILDLEIWGFLTGQF